MVYSKYQPHGIYDTIIGLIKELRIVDSKVLTGYFDFKFVDYNLFGT